MPHERVLDPEEIVLAGKVLSILDDMSSVEARDSAAHLKAVIDQLVRLRQVVTAYPSILLTHTVAGERRDVHSLTDSICRSNPYTIEASMPSRAVVGRAYLVAKFGFFRLLDKIVRHHKLEDGEPRQLSQDIERFVRQTVLTIIAEDILVSIAADPLLHLDLRRKSVYLLADLWEHRTARSVKDFFPLLETIWEAKTRVRITYGALTGTTEVMDLLREGCDPAVIDYFTRDQISDEERQALMELVFNATFEELETMRRYMKRHRMQVLGPEDVAQIFNVPLSRLHQTIATPRDMFFTFRERQVNAYHRALHDMLGPKKTAEEYLMIYYLEQTEVAAPEFVPDHEGVGLR
ncbi:MAG TPA: hypothetical protein PK668_14290 [Myxococcota bacterium]|nr:hypothetical protein [Myxococcota bacterium]HRY93968.1 hypothetical protein [Myxococcota bacterium]HSA23708.1 hypothetical protein [Myxococcota bacterium]